MAAVTQWYLRGKGYEFCNCPFGCGCNFAGVPMGSYLGLKLAQQILGKAEGGSVFGTTPFPTLPFYGGNPWFVPLAMRWFDWKDARFARKGT